MKLEQIDSKNLTFDDAIKNQYSLYYIMETDNGITPYKFVSFSKEGLALPNDNYILVKITKTSEEITPVEVAEKSTKRSKFRRGPERGYKFTGLNDNENIRIAWSINGNKYGGIRVSFPTKEDANDYFDYFREQFYNRDVSSVSVKSIYEDLGISKERIEKECPDAWKWGYLNLHNGGPCKYMTSMVTKNKGDSWFGFTFDPPIIINGLEESGWYAKEKARIEEGN